MNIGHGAGREKEFFPASRIKVEEGDGQAVTVVKVVWRSGALGLKHRQNLDTCNEVWLIGRELRALVSTLRVAGEGRTKLSAHAGKRRSSWKANILWRDQR